MVAFRSVLRSFITNHIRARVEGAHVVQSATLTPSSSSKWAAAAATAAALGLGYGTSIVLTEGPQTSSEAKSPDMWDRWTQVKDFLTGWTKSKGARADVPLPVDKLACHVPAAGAGAPHGRPVVLVSCGSFNPPTYMHTRMMELARQELMSHGFDVLGGYLSPVNDAYWKKGLAPGTHRVKMCQLATADSEFLMVDAWEVEQKQYTRTLYVLRHLQKRLADMFESGAAAPQGCDTIETPRTVLVCGADVVESMADGSIWKQDLLEELLSDHGVVCISRDGAGANAAWLVSQPGTLLNKYKDNVVIVQDPVPNEVSSSAVRRELEAGRSVKYLIVPAVEEHVRAHGLYGTAHKKH